MDPTLNTVWDYTVSTNINFPICPSPGVAFIRAHLSNGCYSKYVHHSLSNSPTLAHTENSSVGQAFPSIQSQTHFQLKIHLKVCIKYTVVSWSQNNTDKMMAKHEMKLLINCYSVRLNKNYIYIRQLLMIYWNEWTKAFSLEN